MRLLDIYHVYPPEHAPAGVQACEFAKDMSRAGHEVTVLTGWPNHPCGILYPGWRMRFREWVRTDGSFDLMRCGHSIQARTRMAWRLWYYLSYEISTLVNGSLCRRPDVVFCESTLILVP